MTSPPISMSVVEDMGIAVGLAELRTQITDTLKIVRFFFFFLYLWHGIGA